MLSSVRLLLGSRGLGLGGDCCLAVAFLRVKWSCEGCCLEFLFVSWFGGVVVDVTVEGRGAGLFDDSFRD